MISLLASDWTTEIVKYLASSDAITENSMALVSKSITGAKLMGVGFFSIAVGYAYLKNIFNNANQKPGNVLDVGYLFRAILIYTLIPLTPNILELIAGLASYGIDLFAMNSQTIAESSEMIYKSAMNMSVDNESQIKVGDIGFWDLLVEIDFLTLSYLGFAILSMIICILIRVILTILTNFIVIFLFIVSPFSMSMSLIPGMEGTFMNFLKYFLSAVFVFLTMNILDNLIFNATLTSLLTGGSLGNEEGVSPLAFIIFCVVIIIMYLLVFWLTTMYIGVPSAGQAAGMVGAMATMAAGAMVAGASGASAAAGGSSGSSGSSAGAAAASGKDALSN